MRRDFYLDLARSGHRVPIGTDLVLHEHDDADAILLDGSRLGGVVLEAAERYRTPLALPLMDLRIEKALLATALGVATRDIDSWHLTDLPTQQDTHAAGTVDPLDHPRARATVEAVARVAQASHGSDRIAVGMGIGPFSLMTKLVADPITPVFLAGTGVTAGEDEEVARIERVFDLGMIVIEKFLTAQIEAGARAIVVCEPAANRVYFSPNQLAQDATVFDRYVMAYNRQVKALLEAHDVDLIFHDCGELIPMMVQRFATLDPAILSLGSSRKLWEDAPLVSTDTVLYGNLPSKHFYSDDLISPSRVRELTGELTRKMSETGHAFILGSECDVLSVPEHHDRITHKVNCMLEL